jgi:hypothetical protein
MSSCGEGWAIQAGVAPPLRGETINAKWSARNQTTRPVESGSGGDGARVVHRQSRKGRGSRGGTPGRGRPVSRSVEGACAPNTLPAPPPSPTTTLRGRPRSVRIPLEHPGHNSSVRIVMGPGSVLIAQTGVAGSLIPSTGSHSPPAKTTRSSGGTRACGAAPVGCRRGTSRCFLPDHPLSGRVG